MALDEESWSQIAPQLCRWEGRDPGVRGSSEPETMRVFTVSHCTAGTGGYAQVRAAVHKETNLRVAIKVVTLPEEDAHLARQSWGASSALMKASPLFVQLPLYFFAMKNQRLGRAR